MQPHTDKRATAARAFVRSLNILLKFARMYDFGHPRTARQYETAWAELRTALGEGDAGVLLSVSADQLLLDGTPLESAAAEKSFARMLSSSGIASIYFSANVSQASLAKFVRAFPTGTGVKPAQLAEQLKTALQGDQTIHVNEVCFVPADSAVAKTTVAAQLAARTLGLTSDEQEEMLQDPEKLLKLIVAAEGMRAASGPGGRAGATERSTEQTEDHGWKRGTGQAHGSGDGDSRDSSVEAHGILEGSATVIAGRSSARTGAGVSGSSPRRSRSSNQSDTTGWNIIGGAGGEAGGGTEIDANAGGFWFKPLGGDSSPNQTSEGNGRGSSENAVLAGAASAIDGLYRGDLAPGAATKDADVGGELSTDAESGPRANSARPGRWTSVSTAVRTPRATKKERGSVTLETGLMTLHEEELQGILQVLAQIARTSGEDRIDPSAFQSRLSHLPRRARFTVSQALSALAAQAPSAMTDKPTLLKLAEHIAVRFALENYERGDLKVDAVKQMLDEMNQELSALRKVVGVYEEKMAEAGIEVPAHTDVLAEEFWAQVPEEKKRAVLDSNDAWCIPPRRIQEFVGQARVNGDSETADRILSRYADCLRNGSIEIRRQSALGMAELAPAYSAAPDRLLTETIRRVGVQLAEETDSELQSLMSAAFVRLSQEAMRKRSYAGLQRSIELIGYVEGERPGTAKNLLPRIGIEDHLPEFIDESLRSNGIPAGLRDLLRRIPAAASEQIASRFSRAGLREDCDLLVSMLEALGPEALDHLRRVLREGPANEAVDTIGILARLDPDLLAQALPVRMRDWKRMAHDRIVRQIAASGSPERGRLLLDLLDQLDRLIQPLAIDEIGMSGEQSANTKLLRIAEQDVPKGQSGYLRLKAIEALGRLRTVAAEAALRKIAEARKAFRWAHPSELRLVAAQSMEKIDPDWVRNFVPRSGLSAAEFSIEPLDPDPNSSAIRQRRYARLRLEYPVPASTTGLKENCQVEIPELTLGGGVALSEQSMHPGSVVGLRMNAGQKNIKAQTIVRDANTQARAFEVVDIDLEERAKLRKVLVQLGNMTKQTSAKDRNRHGARTILSNPT